MDVDVGDAGDLGHLPADLLGQGQVFLPQHADHLHVDRGGQAEVQDLAGDVGRLEIEDAVGEALRQLFPQPGDVVGGRSVFGFERD